MKIKLLDVTNDNELNASLSSDAERLASSLRGMFHADQRSDHAEVAHHERVVENTLRRLMFELTDADLE